MTKKAKIVDLKMAGFTQLAPNIYEFKLAKSEAIQANEEKAMLITKEPPPADPLPEPPALDPYLGPTIAYVHYAPDGALISYGSLAVGFLDDMEADGQLILRDVPNTDFWTYVDLTTMTVKPRPPSEAYLEGTTIYNIPNPARVRVVGEYYDVTDGEFTLEATQPGTYKVSVASGLYMPGEFEIIIL